MLTYMDPQRETGAVAHRRLHHRGAEPIKPSPKLTATVAESIALAKTVLHELKR